MYLSILIGDSLNMHNSDRCDSGNDDKADGDEDNINYSNPWINLPWELLVIVSSYLPLHDKIMMLYACKRCLELSKVPFLWKNLVEPYGRCHIHGVFRILKACGKDVRQIFFPAHLTSAQILEMVHYCTEVTHLCLPVGINLTDEVHMHKPKHTMPILDHPPEHCKTTLNNLEKIISTLKHLQQLNIFLERDSLLFEQSHKSDMFLKSDRLFIRQLMKIIAYSTCKVALRFSITCYSSSYVSNILTSIKKLSYQGDPLPATISTFFPSDKYKYKMDKCDRSLLELTSRPSSFEIALYDSKTIPMNLYSPVPFVVYKCGTPPLIRLSDHGIRGLKHDIFHLSEYNDHHGSNHHILVCNEFNYQMADGYFNSIKQLDSVSCIDLSSVNVDCYHLNQFAFACPNLQRLNLKDNVDCLYDLQGLQAIVYTCQNLESLNLSGISISRVQSYLLLWELLSSLKKLTFLTIDLCMLRLYDFSNDEQQRLVTMCESFHKLQALDIYCESGCRACHMYCNKRYLLFSYFPSLTYCAMWKFQYSALEYAITQCHHLKYLYDHGPYYSNELLFTSSKCQLREIKICGLYTEITNSSAKAFSAHHKLERVILHIRSITHKGIAILIDNSPNLIFLEVSDHFSCTCEYGYDPDNWDPHNRDPHNRDDDPTARYSNRMAIPVSASEEEICTVKRMLTRSYHILFDVGTFVYGH